MWRTESSPKATREEKDRYLADHLLVLKIVVHDNACIRSARQCRIRVMARDQ